jgi:hypothetical protein
MNKATRKSPTTSEIMEASLFLPSASTTSLQRQSSPSQPKSGTNNADVTPLEVLNSTAAKEIYSRLDENVIRFVVLQAGEPTDLVQCSLITGHLDALPKYEALSYVWGSQENPKTIHLNGQTLFITQNLHQALIRLRKPAKDRVIWIDALAINQSDILERNTQVQKMLIIYRSARAVLGWIGQGDEDLGFPTEAWASACLSQGLKLPDWDCIFNQVHDRDPVQLFFSFKWLNEYEFWSRAWIIQEITHSNAVFILGPYEATYEHLGQIWLQLMVQHYPLYNVEAGENPADCAKSIGSRISTIFLTSIPTVGPDGMLDLDSWLKSFILMHESRCLDPHDMIYAFYSLFTPEIEGKISIDYTMPIADLFALMTRVYVETTGNLWLLSYVETSSRCCSATPTVDTGLPTWAFNFAGEISTFSRWHKPLCDKGIKDGNTSIFYHRFEMSVRSLLHVKGVCIGQVHQVDRSPRHKFLLGTSFQLSKWSLDVTCNEEVAFRLAFLRPFAEPEDFSSLLVQDFDSFNALDRKYWSKIFAASNSHFERLMFSYIPKHGRGQSNERGSQRQFALGNPGVLIGDKVCLIHGCPLPLLLRQAGNSYTVVGSAYAQGYMEGEAMDALGINIDDLEDFCLC